MHIVILGKVEVFFFFFFTVIMGSFKINLDGLGNAAYS